MDVRVVIVNWNTVDYLRACLASLSRYTPAGDDQVGAEAASPRVPDTDESLLRVEVIVVDNASSDGSAAMTAMEFPNVRLIASADNLGWAKGNNVGIEASQGRYVFLLNPDTVVKPGALETLTQFMDAHPDAGACTPQLLNTDGSIQRSLRRFPEPLFLVWDVLGLSKLFPRSRFGAYRMSDFTYEQVAEVDQPMGAALFIRRETLHAVGVIDEAFPIFFNDVDWCYRAKRGGWKIYFVPDAEVVHHGGSSTAQVKPRMVTESHRSLERYYRKHYRERLPGVALSAIVALSRAVERLRIRRAERAARKNLDSPPASPGRPDPRGHTA